MKKLLTSSVVISSLILAPALQADAVDSEDSENGNQTEMQANDTVEDEGTHVGQAANDGSSAARKKRWQNIALAAGAVAIAVTALILVANNDGHKK